VEDLHIASILAVSLENHSNLEVDVFRENTSRSPVGTTCCQLDMLWHVFCPGSIELSHWCVEVYPLYTYRVTLWTSMYLWGFSPVRTNVAIWTIYVPMWVEEPTKTTKAIIFILKCVCACNGKK
jgi:hypothetical protein